MLGLEAVLKSNCFPLCIDINILWKRYWVSLGSCVTAVILLPSSVTNSMARSFQEPPVSIATGVKWWVLASSMYLTVLLEAARLAAAIALVAMSPMYELAYLSAIVMSQANGLPCVHGMRVALSGLIIINIIIYYHIFFLAPATTKPTG